jgi:hypothetical protein
MPEKFTATAPAFVTVSVNGLLVLEMFPLPNDRFPGEKLRAVPTPLKLIVVGLLGSESTTLRVPACVPFALGTKTEDTWQLLNPGIDVPQVELGEYWLNSGLE